jgi:DNA-binding CsgD family transcriptional regulator
MLVGFTRKNDALSARQLNVLQGRALGISYEEIAEYMDISPKTVEEHRRRAYAKIRCHSGHEAAKWLHKVGYYVDREQWELLVVGKSDIEDTRKVVEDKITKGLADMWSQTIKKAEEIGYAVGTER